MRRSRWMALMLTAAWSLSMPSAAVTAWPVSNLGPSVAQTAVMEASQPFDLHWTNDGVFLVLASARGLWWYQADDLSAEPLHQPFEQLRAFDLDAEGQRVALGDALGRVVIVDRSGAVLATWQVTAPDASQPNAVRALAFAPSGKQIAISTDQKVLAVYNLDKQQLEWLTTDGLLVKALCFSPDGKTLAIGNEQSSIDLRDTLSGKPRRDWKLDVLTIESLSDIDYSPSGERLLIGGKGGRILALDVIFGERGYDWLAESGAAARVDWSSDGRYVAIANDGSGGGPESYSLQVWRAELGGAAVAVMVGHSGTVRGLAFSPNGERLASLSDDGTLRLWQVASGALLDQASYPTAP